MGITDAIINYRRHLKRRNYSQHTIKNYMNTLKHFVMWVKVPIEAVGSKNILSYIDHLLDRRLRPKTINCHLDSIRGFYDYMIYEEDVQIVNPVKPGYIMRLAQPLPRYLRKEEVISLFKIITKTRDRAIFMLMLRCGLRVEEVTNLRLADLDLPRSQLLIYSGKGAKDRMVYISDDTYEALAAYLKVRENGRARKLFLVEKGTYKGKPISVRGIQKRIEYYSRKAGLKVSCHQLRHTMATDMLNADADLVSIQDLLGHTWVKTTQRYCKVSNLKVERDYHKAMQVIMERQAM